MAISTIVDKIKSIITAKWSSGPNAVTIPTFYDNVKNVKLYPALIFLNQRDQPSSPVGKSARVSIREEVCNLELLTADSTDAETYDQNLMYCIAEFDKTVTTEWMRLRGYDLDDNIHTGYYSQKYVAHLKKITVVS